MWIMMRSRGQDDAARASKLVAAYVADCVREDRVKRPSKRDLVDTVLDSFFDLIGGK